MFKKILIAKRAGRRSSAVAALLLVGAAQPAAPEPFAIAYTGEAQFADSMAGSRSYELPTQIYVFDEGTNRVQHALEPRQEFEDVCFRGGYIDRVSFSPGLISVRSEQTGRMCDFSVNRQTGDAEYVTHTDLPGGGFSQIEFRMTCSPAEISVFDRSRNRF